jgi:hypothetical protein
MKTQSLHYVLMMLIFLFSCGSAEQSSLGIISSGGSDKMKNTSLESSSTGDVEATTDETADETADVKTVLYSMPSPGMEIKIPEKIIKTANISVEVETYTESIIEIRKKIKQWKGYISTENEINYSDYTNNTISIRVPGEKFEGLVEELTKGVKKVDSKTVTSEDVTAEFVDVTARLKTKKEVELRYLELLKQAKSINDILQVEEQLRVIREEIEAKEGRLKLLNDQASYSTINLTVYEKYADQYEPGFFSKTGDALSAGWNGIKIFFIGLIYVWPFWILLAAGLFILRYYLRKARKNRLDKAKV